MGGDKWCLCSGLRRELSGIRSERRFLDSEIIFPVRVDLVASSRTSSRFISKSSSQLTLPNKSFPAAICLLTWYFVITQVLLVKGLYSSSHNWVVCPVLPNNDLLAISAPSFDSFFHQNKTHELLEIGDSVSEFHLVDLLVDMEFINTVF